MKIYKVNIEPYDVEAKKENGEIKTITIYPKWELPRIICNNALGSEKPGQPAKEFDLLELGPIAQEIDNAEGLYVSLPKVQYDSLLKRIKGIASYFSFERYEMLRRVVEAKESEAQVK